MSRLPADLAKTPIDDGLCDEALGIGNQVPMGTVTRLFFSLNRSDS